VLLILTQNYNCNVSLNCMAKGLYVQTKQEVCLVINLLKTVNNHLWTLTERRLIHQKIIKGLKSAKKSKRTPLKGVMSMTNSNVDTGQQDMVVEGYAIIFNSMSDDLGGFKEIVAPNALDGVDV